MTRPCQVDQPIEKPISKRDLLSDFNGYCNINFEVPQICSSVSKARDEYLKSIPIYKPPKKNNKKPIKVMFKKNISSPEAQCAAQIPCPLCGEKFSMYEIEQHASLCNT